MEQTTVIYCYSGESSSKIGNMCRFKTIIQMPFSQNTEDGLTWQGKVLRKHAEINVTSKESKSCLVSFRYIHYLDCVTYF